MPPSGYAHRIFSADSGKFVENDGVSWRHYLPVETIIKERQQDYYAVLQQCDQQAESTAFISFILDALVAVIEESEHHNDQVNDQVSDQLRKLLAHMTDGVRSAKQLCEGLNLKHAHSFRQHYLTPALNTGLIEMTIPEKRQSRLQKYHLTPKGWALIGKL